MSNIFLFLGIVLLTMKCSVFFTVPSRSYVPVEKVIYNLFFNMQRNRNLKILDRILYSGYFF